MRKLAREAILPNSLQVWIVSSKFDKQANTMLKFCSLQNGIFSLAKTSTNFSNADSKLSKENGILENPPVSEWHSIHTMNAEVFIRLKYLPLQAVKYQHCLIMKMEEKKNQTVSKALPYKLRQK